MEYKRKKESRVTPQVWPKQLKTEPSLPKPGKTAEGAETIRNSVSYMIKFEMLSDSQADNLISNRVFREEVQAGDRILSHLQIDYILSYKNRITKGESEV